MTRPHDDYSPASELLDAFPDVSGNEINGLGEPDPRPASPFFWHPLTKQPFGKLQEVVPIPSASNPPGLVASEAFSLGRPVRSEQL